MSTSVRGAEGVVRKRISLRGASFEAPASWRQDATVTFAAPGPAPRPTLSLTRLDDREASASLETLIAKRVGSYASLLAALEVKASGDVPVPGGRASEARLAFEELEGPMVLRLMALEVGSQRFMLSGRALAIHDAQLNAAFDVAAMTLGPFSLGDAVRSSFDQDGRAEGSGPARKVEYAGVSFTPPPGWEEESMVIVGPAGRRPKPTLTLSRLGVGREVSLASAVSRFVAQVSAAVPVEILESGPTRAAGLRGTELLIGYEGDVKNEETEGPALQKLVFLEATDAVWVLAGAAALRGAPAMNEELEHALASLKLPESESKGW